MRRAAIVLALLAALPPASARAVPPPDPLRFADEIRAFAVTDSIAPAPRGAIAFYGSSSLRLWHERLGQDFQPWVVVGRGFGGSTMSEAAHWFDRVVAPLRPRIVVLYEGDNDIEMGRTPDEVIADFTGLVARMRAALPDARLVVLAIKPSEARWAKWPAMQQANARLASLCAKSGGRLVYVDVATPLLGADGRPRPGLYLEDRLHLSPAGYEAWRKVLAPVLDEVAAKLGDVPRSDRSGWKHGKTLVP